MKALIGYKKTRIIEPLIIGIEILFSLWALTEDSLVVLNADLSFFEQISDYLQQFPGWDMRSLILALGLGCIYAKVFRGGV